MYIIFPCVEKYLYMLQHLFKESPAYKTSYHITLLTGFPPVFVSYVGHNFAAGKERNILLNNMHYYDFHTIPYFLKVILHR